MYIVYEHKNTINDKIYIGYTSKTMTERLHKHYVNATAGVDTAFYRAIRKYGLDVFESRILGEYITKKEATDMEIHFIKEYDSFKSNSYNCTAGGDGGWSVPDDKYNAWLEKMRHNAFKENNARWSGISDDDILKLARGYFLEHGHNSSINTFVQWGSKNHSIPKSYSKNRFDGKTLKAAYCEKYNVDPSELKHTKSEEHKKALAAAGKGKRWYHNSLTGTNKQWLIPPNNHDWKIGRIL